MSAAGLNITIGGNATAAVTVLTDVERELARLGSAAQAAGTEAQAGLNKAFSTVGVRSEQAIKAEIDALTNALHAMATSGQVSGAEMQRAFVAAGQKIEALHQELQPIAPSLNAIQPAAQQALSGQPLCRTSIGAACRGDASEASPISPG